jgi:hypothetical protein
MASLYYYTKKLIIAFYLLNARMSVIVYVDHENIPFHKYEKIFATVLKGKNVLAYKIFASIREITKLDDSIRLKHKFILCQRPVCRDKNSADISLVIEIMKDYFRNPAVTTFIIVSNDSDFIPICKELQEGGKHCWLLIDSPNANDNMDKIYNKVIDIGKESREVERIEEEIRMKKILSDIRSKIKEYIEEYKIVYSITYLKDEGKISINKFMNILNHAEFDWKLRNPSYKDFLKLYLPLDYKYLDLKMNGGFIVEKSSENTIHI